MRILADQTSQALRHRRGQAIALLLLAATVTALSVCAPLYSRAMGQALTHLEILQTSRVATSLQITSQPAGGSSFNISGQQRPVAPSRLAGVVPASIRDHYGAPELSRSAHADSSALGVSGQVFWRPGVCAHLKIVAGRCPSGADQMIVSRADLDLPGVRLGGAVPIAAVTQRNGAPPTVPLRVVGVYQFTAGSFWQTRDPVGMSGTPGPTGINHDDWFTGEATFLARTRTLPGLFSTATFPLDPDTTDIDDVLALPGQIARFTESLSSSALSGRVDVTSSLGDVRADVATQQDQANRTVPLLMLQVALLALVVFWQILAAAADQRRPDVALARLRGVGARTRIGLLLRELLLVTESGVILGAAAGIGIAAAARRLFLPTAPVELPTSYWLTALACAAGIGALTWLTARNLAREPIDKLLRQVPIRRGWHWSAFDTVLFTLAAAGVVAFAAGGLGHGFALAGPALVALLVGLILSHLVTPAATGLGRSALRRGQLVGGLAALEAARRPGARRMITMLTLAAAFLVFFANAWAVGSANREQVAEQVVGARRVITVATTSLTPVQHALDKVDPTGTEATPVVFVSPLGESTAPSTMAVVPDQFAHLALLDEKSRALPWRRLRPESAAPVRIRGTHLSVGADAAGLRHDAGVIHVGLRLLDADDVDVTSVTLGTLRPSRGRRRTTLRTLVPCARGCTILAVSVESEPGARARGTFRLDPIRGTTTTPWGPAGAWPAVRSTDSTIRGTAARSGALDVAFDTGGLSDLTLSSGWLPPTIPAISLGRQPDAAAGRPALLGVDRMLHPVAVVAHASHLPSAPVNALVVDLEALARGAQIDPGDQVQIWIRHDDRAFFDRLRSALADNGVATQSSTTVSALRSRYGASVAAWSLSLALVTGLITLLITLLAMVVLTVTSWRSTAHDLAALQMSGVDPRALLRGTVLAHVITVGVAVGVGALAGGIAGWLAIGQVPLFAHQPALSVVDLSPSWPTIAVTVVLTLVVLLVAAIAIARRVAGRATLDRLRGES